jgi:hypothetical protein
MDQETLKFYTKYKYLIDKTDELINYEYDDILEKKAIEGDGSAATQ